MIAQHEGIADRWKEARDTGKQAVRQTAQTPSPCGSSITPPSSAPRAKCRCAPDPPSGWDDALSEKAGFWQKVARAIQGECRRLWAIKFIASGRSTGRSVEETRQGELISRNLFRHACQNPSVKAALLSEGRITGWISLKRIVPDARFSNRRPSLAVSRLWVTQLPVSRWARPKMILHRRPRPFPPALLKRALAALNRNSARIVHRDRIGVVDFSTSSARRRLHIVDLASGRTTSMLVAHGRGSDPAHTGWLQRFSNQPGSNATSQGPI